MAGDTLRQGATATITGRVTGDADIKFTNGGKQVANFSVAVNHRRKNPDTGEWADDGAPDFYRVAAWAEAAEPAAHLTKGALVRVTGRLRTREYTTRTGETRLSLDITTDNPSDIETATAPQEADPWT